MNFFQKYKKIFIVGIAGAGTSALAHFLNSKKCSVSGSDTGYNKNLDNISDKVFVYKEFSEKNIDETFDLLIYSSVWNENTPERKKAKELKIKELTYFEAIGEISKEFNTIAVSGTNGKSTTTALAAALLDDTIFDPYVVLGAGVKGFGFENNFRDGRTDNFIVEACEYQAHMLFIHPKTIILTNIEAEHLDYYKDINHIIETFKKYIKKLRIEDHGVINENVLIYNKDCKNVCKVAKYAETIGLTTLSFSVDGVADLVAKNVVNKNEKQFFELFYKNEKIGNYSLNVPGVFNISNLLGAILNYINLSGIINENVKDRIKLVCDNFNGIERRFEIFKKDLDKDIIYVNDYAHNPYKIKATISGVKEFYKNRRIVSVFQPHTYDRTKKLFNEFVDSFEDSDLNIFSEIYEPANRDLKSDKNISSDDLKNEVENKFNKKSFFAKNLEEAVILLKKNLKNSDIVLIMGAGDINKICEKI